AQRDQADRGDDADEIGGNGENLVDEELGDLDEDIHGGPPGDEGRGAGERAGAAPADGSDGVDAAQGRVDLRLRGEVLDDLDAHPDLGQGVRDRAGGEDRIGVLRPALRRDGVRGLHVQVRGPAPAVQDL